MVQGYGDAGSFSAIFMHEMGAKVIAVSDSKGGIYNPNGLDPYAVLEHKQKTGSVGEFPGSEYMNNENLLELECEIFIPAALENQITRENAPRLRPTIFCLNAVCW